MFKLLSLKFTFKVFFIIIVAVGVGRAACTTKLQNKVRSGPSGQDDLVIKLPRYIPVKILEKKDEWFKVKGKGFKGWIFHSLVDEGADCVQIVSYTDPYCLSTSPRLRRRISKGEGFKVIKKSIGCIDVKGKWGGKTSLNIAYLWPRDREGLLIVPTSKKE